MPSQEKPQQPEQQTEVVRTKGPSFRTIYANNVQLDVNIWDFRLSFGEIDKIDAATNRLFVTESVSVIMSPQQAKVLSGILADNVAKYESQVGEIKIGQPQKNA